MKNASPDGYTVAWASTSILTTTNIGNVPFKHDALDHLGRVEWQPMPFAVKGDARWGTFEEFANECRANPGTLKVANSGTGSAAHLAAIAIVEAIARFKSGRCGLLERRPGPAPRPCDGARPRAT